MCLWLHATFCLEDTLHISHKTLQYTCVNLILVTCLTFYLTSIGKLPHNTHAGLLQNNGRETSRAITNIKKAKKLQVRFVNITKLLFLDPFSLFGGIIFVLKFRIKLVFLLLLVGKLLCTSGVP